MTATQLPPAIRAEELTWALPTAGRVLCYHRGGQGVPLLLLHSINAAPSAFEVSPFFDDLDLPMPLYAPDLPGFGRSNREERAYLPDFFAAAINEMAEAIGASEVDVIALSTTCEFVARAARAPESRLRRLVFVSPTGLSRRRARPSGAGPRVHSVLTAPFLGSGLFRLLRGRSSVRFFLDKAFAERAPQAMVDYAVATAAQPGASHAPFYFLSGQLFDHDAVGNLYLPLENPVLLLYDQDPNVGFAHMEEVDTAKVQWTLRRIPGTHGLPHFERPLETQDALLDFLAGEDSSAEG